MPKTQPSEALAKLVEAGANRAGTGAPTGPTATGELVGELAAPALDADAFDDEPAPACPVLAGVCPGLGELELQAAASAATAISDPATIERFLAVRIEPNSCQRSTDSTTS